MGVFVGILGLTWGLFQVVPKGFIPVQDKQYLVGLVQLPNAASLNRTDEVMRRVGDIALERPGRARGRAVPRPVDRRFHATARTRRSCSSASMPSRSASPRDLYGLNIAKQLNMKLSAIQDAQVVVFPPPPVQGLGTIGGFKLQLEDRADLGYDELYKATQAVLAKARQTPELDGRVLELRGQRAADQRRRESRQGEGARHRAHRRVRDAAGVSRLDLRQRLQPLRPHVPGDRAGGLPVSARRRKTSCGCKTRNEAGEMVPLGSVVQVSQSYGPDRVFRYNGYLTADVNGGPAPGYSSGQAQAAMERILAETLPNGVKYEWTDLTYQEIIAGNSSVFVFPLCVLLVVLVLAALYESWTLPLAIVAIVPMALFSAIVGVWLTGGDNNIFTQIALFVLVGLASKNAILIVEFAKDREQAGVEPVAAALEAARLRLRPILMTSIAFIMGVVPLVFSSGAGAEMRHAIGIAVFSGMIGVTFFGLFLTPLFYVLLRAAVLKRRRAPAAAIENAEGATHA